VSELAAHLKVLVPMDGLIDLDAERARVSKEIERFNKVAGQARGKLGNANFTDKAPEAVVQKERDKLADAEATLERLEAELKRLG
jgi:valyl-tRNA synthetase